MPRPAKSQAVSEYDLPPALWVATEQLRPWAKNPRKNDHAVDKVCASITRWGFGAPLIARRENGEIIAGHTRLKAALKLKLKMVPVRYLDLSEEQAHQLALADNKLGEEASWDDGALLEILSQWSTADRDLAGWSDKDMAALERATGTGGDLKEDDAPPLPAQPITKLGDVWRMGRHVLICGDSTQAITYQQLRMLNGDRGFGLMTTDPPYGVNAVVGTTDPRQQKGDPRKRYAHNGDKESVIANDDLTGEKLEEFLRATWIAAAPALAPGAAWYVWFAGTNAMQFMRAAELLGGFKHQLVWVKPHFVFGRSDYHYRHEPCLYGWTPGGGHAWLGGRSQTSVFEIALDKAVGSSVHPSVKPVELYAIPIRNHLGADGTLIDPFSGTGPAFSAAEQLERTCYGIELSPGYCDVIVERWENLTGGKATRGSATSSRPKAASERAPAAPHSRSKKGKSPPAESKKKASRARAS
jgi:DNA modification methylase